MELSDNPVFLDTAVVSESEELTDSGDVAFLDTAVAIPLSTVIVSDSILLFDVAVDDASKVVTDSVSITFLDADVVKES